MCNVVDFTFLCFFSINLFLALLFIFKATLINREVTFFIPFQKGSEIKFESVKHYAPNKQGALDEKNNEVIKKNAMNYLKVEGKRPPIFNFL